MNIGIDQQNEKSGSVSSDSTWSMIVVIWACILSSEHFTGVIQESMQLNQGGNLKFLALHITNFCPQKRPKQLRWKTYKISQSLFTKRGGNSKLDQKSMNYFDRSAKNESP